MFGRKLLVLRIIIAALLLQTLYYKFSSHPDSVFIFSQVGLEPFGRIGIGVLELISAILLLNSRSIWIGAVLTIGIISAAVITHLTNIGIVVNNDGGALFYMALLILILSSIILINERKNIPIIGKKL